MEPLETSPTLTEGSEPVAEVEQPQQAPPPSNSRDDDNLADLAELKAALLKPEEFDAAEFCDGLRQSMPWEHLQTNLKQHYNTISEELFEVINRDYNDFINLSSGLVGVDSAIEAVRQPVLQIRTDVSMARDAIQQHMNEVQSKLDAREALEERRNALLRLQEAAAKISNIEALVADIAQAEEKAEAAGWQWGKLDTQATRSSTALRLHRVAGSIQFAAALVELCEPCKYRQSLESRLGAATTMFHEHLAAALLAVLKQKDRGEVEHCLRAYETIGDIEGAEALIRSRVVRPAVRSAVTLDRLHAGRTTSGRCDGLASMYEGLYASITEAMGPLLPVSPIDTTVPQSDSGSTEVAGLKPIAEAFRFTSEAVWVEIVAALLEVASAVFAPGIPEVFHRNYSLTSNLVNRIEALCHSDTEKMALRAQPSFTELHKKWNLTVYFQLRLNEISSSLEEAFQAPISVRKASDHDGLTLLPSAMVIKQVQRTWGDGIFLPILVGKFYKLHLQILCRYRAWLLGTVVPAAKEASAANKGPVSALTDGSDKALTIDTLAYVSLDVMTVQAALEEMQEAVLGKCNVGDEASVALVENSYKASVESLKQLVVTLRHEVEDMLTTRCKTTLNQIRSISQTYLRTNRPPPTHHSYFVSNVLSSLSTYLEEMGDAMPEAQKKAIAEVVVTDVCIAYEKQASDLINTARKTEDSLKKFEKTGPGEQGTVSDVDKMCLQVQLDVKEFGNHVSEVWGTADELPAYQALKASVG